ESLVVVAMLVAYIDGDSLVRPGRADAILAQTTGNFRMHRTQGRGPLSRTQQVEVLQLIRGHSPIGEDVVGDTGRPDDTRGVGGCSGHLQRIVDVLKVEVMALGVE